MKREARFLISRTPDELAENAPHKKRRGKKSRPPLKRIDDDGDDDDDPSTAHRTPKVPPKSQPEGDRSFGPSRRSGEPEEKGKCPVRAVRAVHQNYRSRPNVLRPQTKN
jgi:hypothetical protein